LSNDARNVPVLMLLFNRPHLTERTFEAVRAARPARLYLAADGPRPRVRGEAERCARARAVADRVDWPCEVRTRFRDENLGLRRAVPDAIAWLFDEEEAGVILEDDCLAGPGFFRFCAELLDRYATDERVMMVSGNNFLDRPPQTRASYYFSRLFRIWGWATWRRAWARYDPDMRRWPEVRGTDFLLKILPDRRWVVETADALDRVHAGQLESWAWRWVFSCWTHKGLSAVPVRNLVMNIGFGPEATHTTAVDPRKVRPAEEMGFPLTHPDAVAPDAEADQREILALGIRERWRAAARLRRAVRRALPRPVVGALRWVRARLHAAQRSKPERSHPHGAASQARRAACYQFCRDRYVRATDVVLNLGGGLEEGLRMLGGKAQALHGVEVDERALARAQRVFEGHPLVKSLSLYDGRHLPFPDKSVDGVVCVEALERVEDYEAFLRELARVARRFVFLSTPRRRPERALPDGRPKDRPHLREWSYAELEEILSNLDLPRTWHFLDGEENGPFRWAQAQGPDTRALVFVLRPSEQGAPRSVRGEA